MRDFVRNFASGLGLAFGRRASLLDFRIGVGALILLYLFSVLLDIGVEYVRLWPDAAFSPHAVVTEGFHAIVLMLCATALAFLFRQPHLRLAVPVIVLASTPVLALYSLALLYLSRQDGMVGARSGLVGYWFYFAWLAFIFFRTVATALSPAAPGRAVRSLAGTAIMLVAVPLAMWTYEPWWLSGTQEFRPGDPGPASEEVLAAQPRILDEALSALDDQRVGVVDLYFVGFAPYSREDVFRKDVLVAQDVLDERFDTRNRSVVLVNNPQTMLSTPLATVSNLRETLNEIGATINPDEDVVMVYLASHGSANHQLAIDFPPLSLQQMTPAILHSLLEDAGIKWRILVVSSCYSGGFVDALKDDYTLVITASATDRQSFGCGTESDSTYFGDAFFNHALRHESSLPHAFEEARDEVAARERTEGRTPPSDPQIYVGALMGEKLVALEAAQRVRRIGRTATRSVPGVRPAA